MKFNELKKCTMKMYFYKCAKKTIILKHYFYYFLSFKKKKEIKEFVL